MGFSKLTSIFSDLEKQGFIKEGTILELENHFTESLFKEMIQFFNSNSMAFSKV